MNFQDITRNIDQRFLARVRATRDSAARAQRGQQNEIVSSTNEIQILAKQLQDDAKILETMGEMRGNVIKQNHEIISDYNSKISNEPDVSKKNDLMQKRDAEIERKDREYRNSEALKDVIANKYKRIKQLLDSDPKNIVNGVTPYAFLSDTVKRQIDKIREGDKQIDEELKGLDATDLKRINDKLGSRLEQKIEKLIEKDMITQEEYDDLAIDNIEDIRHDEKKKNIELRALKDKVNKLINKHMMSSPNDAMTIVDTEHPTEIENQVDSYLQNFDIDAINDEETEGRQGEKKTLIKTIPYQTKVEAQKRLGINTLVEEIAALEHVDPDNIELKSYVNKLTKWNHSTKPLTKGEATELTRMRKSLREKFGDPTPQYNTALYKNYADIVFSNNSVSPPPASIINNGDKTPTNQRVTFETPKSNNKRNVKPTPEPTRRAINIPLEIDLIEEHQQELAEEIARKKDDLRRKGQELEEYEKKIKRRILEEERQLQFISDNNEYDNEISRIQRMAEDERRQITKINNELQKQRESFIRNEELSRDNLIKKYKDRREDIVGEEINTYEYIKNMENAEDDESKQLARDDYENTQKLYNEDSRKNMEEQEQKERNDIISENDLRFHYGKQDLDENIRHTAKNYVINQRGDISDDYNRGIEEMYKQFLDEKNIIENTRPMLHDIDDQPPVAPSKRETAQPKAVTYEKRNEREYELTPGTEAQSKKNQPNKQVIDIGDLALNKHQYYLVDKYAQDLGYANAEAALPPEAQSLLRNMRNGSLRQSTRNKLRDTLKALQPMTTTVNSVGNGVQKYGKVGKLGKGIQSSRKVVRFII